MTAVAKVSSRRPVTIPKEICERMGGRPGQKIPFVPRIDGFIAEPAPEREELAGMARCANAEDCQDRKDRV